MYGAPVRGTRHEAEARLSECLLLNSAGDRFDLKAGIMPGSTLADEWGALAGNLPVLLVRNVQIARRVVFKLLGLKAGDALQLAANSSHTLIEAVKHAELMPDMLTLSESLSPQSSAAPFPLWQEMRWGLPLPLANHLGPLIVDGATTVVIGPLPVGVEIGIFGCHLAPDEKEAGALLVFANIEQWQIAKALLQRQDCLTPAQALAAVRQVRRLQTLIPAQLERLQQVAAGVIQAAGLPPMALSNHFALAHGVAVQIPFECDPATFVTYAKGENTPVQWLSEVAPIHPAARQQMLSSAQNLARWLLIPVNPHYDEGLICQAVLGVVKAAEYLGVRWRTNPMRAAAYAQLLTTMYGSQHDAYRPAFATTAYSVAELAQLGDVAQPAFCQLS